MSAEQGIENPVAYPSCPIQAVEGTQSREELQVICSLEFKIVTSSIRQGTSRKSNLLATQSRGVTPGDCTSVSIQQDVEESEVPFEVSRLPS